MSGRVLRDLADGIATLALNRPEKLNALDLELSGDLIDGLNSVIADPKVRVVVITGVGRAFCAGGDLNILGNDGDVLVRAGKEIALLVRSAPMPVLAVVNGAAAGGGANLALACDYRIASEKASIGQVFHKLGLGPDWGGSWFLPRQVGLGRALELVWSARMVPAAEAHGIGLFERVVPADRLEAEARALAATWAGFPALAVRRAKEAIILGAGASLAESLDFEIGMQHELFATPEAQDRLAQSLTTRSR